jgi:hypothetical protein
MGTMWRIVEIAAKMRRFASLPPVAQLRCKPLNCSGIAPQMVSSRQLPTAFQQIL